MKITPTITIRAKLEHYLQQEGLNLLEFAHISGMNRGIISNIVSENKPMSINQLDLITEALGLPKLLLACFEDRDLKAMTAIF
ncbi:hypothetical protein AOU00_20825 [Paenibacillus polymyxa]|nr:hypothetical protein AOU00_20825 [Paenibacillus polymyxa]KYG92802.1 hypothetical protein AZE31_02805 [Paenibacillus polymyxa]